MVTTQLLLTAFSLPIILWSSVSAQPLIIDHACTNIKLIPTSAIETARSKLHIAYGHTSHGSQITTGMTGLVAFANGGGKGMKHPQNIFAWNNGGSNGALDLVDGGVLPGDVGYYPDWVNATRNLLNNPLYSRINVIMWSWCGQVTSKHIAGRLFSEYLTPMSQLEKDFPNVKFVYMTGHVDHGADASNKAANDVIRNFCRTNNRILFDFADIESYNPDGKYFEFVSDGCDYYNSAGQKVGNWAIEWQNTHTQNVDWYDCPSAHSQPLNANQKAYAAWWMFAAIAGWGGTADIEDINDLPSTFELYQNYPNPFNPNTSFEFRVSGFEFVSLKVLDVLGREVATLVDEYRQPGAYRVRWDASGLPSGVYFYRMRAGGFVDTKKMILGK